MKWALPLKNMKYQHWLSVLITGFACVFGEGIINRGTLPHMCQVQPRAQVLLSIFHGFSEIQREEQTLEVWLSVLLMWFCFFSCYFPFLSPSVHGKGRGEVQPQKVLLLFQGARSAVAPYHKARSLGPSKNAQGIPVTRRRWEGEGYVGRSRERAEWDLSITDSMTEHGFCQ